MKRKPTESAPIKAAADVYRAVQDETGITPEQIMGRRKTARVTRARHMVIAALHVIRPEFTLTDLAQSVRRKDHGTAHNAIKRSKRDFLAKEDFKLSLLRIVRAVKESACHKLTQG